MNPTAWIIDKDHLFDPSDDSAAGISNEVGVTGPSTAPGVLLDRLSAGEGVTFQMYDGDDELYYTGRIIALEDDGTDQAYPDCGEEFFRPLWDYGAPNAGAVDIRYRDSEGKWQGL